MASAMRHAVILNAFIFFTFSLLMSWLMMLIHAADPMVTTVVKHHFEPVTVCESEDNRRHQSSVKNQLQVVVSYYFSLVGVG